MEVDELVEKLLAASMSGTFKTTTRLAESIPSLAGHNDFSYVDMVVNQGMPPVRGNAHETWERAWSREDGNVIIVNAYTMDTASMGGRILRAFGNKDAGYTHMIEMSVVPGQYVQDRKYSVDHRTPQGKRTIGTAHIALNFTVPKQTLIAFDSVVRRGGAVVNDILARMPLRYSGIEFNPYDGFISREPEPIGRVIRANPERTLTELGKPVFEVRYERH